MGRQRTHEEYLELLVDRDILYLPLEEYRSAHYPLDHECPEGHIWKVSPNNLLKGRRCSVCSGRKKKDTGSYIEELAKSHPTISVLGDYFNNKTHVLHRCNVCSTEWPASPTNILRGGGCPHCARRKTIETYEAELLARGSELRPIEPYVDSSTKILHRCYKEGHEYRTSPHKVLERLTCSQCRLHARPHILYYIRIAGYYKVGVTYRTVEERFKTSFSTLNVFVLKTWEFPDYHSALEQEQEILRVYRDQRVYLPDLIPESGGTELFMEDILQLDSKPL